MISDFHHGFRRCGIATLLFAAAFPSGRADEVVFSDDSGLNGKITALLEDGRLVLSSPLSHDPLELRADRVKRVVFAPKDPASDSHDALVQLANGDLFPCDLTAIDATTVRTRTSFAGDLAIPRSAIHTVQLGMRPRKLLYRGPSGAEGWDMRGGWRLENGRFIAESGGTLSRQFDAPESFSLRFRVRWRSSPDLTVHFADEGLKSGGKSNRYVLRFNPSGFELKREQDEEGRRDPPMIQVLREPSTFSNSMAEIDLRLDRKMHQVHFYVNGEYEGRFPDPLGGSPMGGGLLFRSGLGGDETLQIDQIELREWDASADRHRAEERGDGTQDAIILRDGQRGPARILGLHPDADGGDIEFKSPHLPKNERLPVSEISTLFFARSDGEGKTGTPMKLELRGRGSLGLASCTFTDDMLHASHPLLGDLEIRRDAVARLERPRRDPNPDENEP